MHALERLACAPLAEAAAALAPFYAVTHAEVAAPPGKGAPVPAPGGGSESATAAAAWDYLDGLLCSPHVPAQVRPTHVARSCHIVVRCTLFGLR